MVNSLHATINVLIADDHTMFADGIESLLKVEEKINVIGKCFDGASIFDVLPNQQVDVLLLDVNLPKMNGIEVCKKLSSDYPKVRVLALSMYNEESFISEILNNGASGYILKNTGRTELLNAIHKVYAGESYFSKEVTQTIMNSLVRSEQAEQKKKVIPKISRREKEVLKLIVAEHTTQEIGEKLFISLKTVESHRSNLLAKLNARNTAGLVRIAFEHKLLDD